MSSFLARRATSGVQHKRGPLSRLMVTSALVAVGTVAIAASANAADYTLPTGADVVGGSSTISQSGIDKLNINQHTDRTVINWDSFNIGTDATVQFYQPNSGSLAVNRVVGVGSDPTRILGTLRANGQVMVLDRNGVLFGKGAIVDVGSIVASTGDIDSAAVMNGASSLSLNNFGLGEILNEGQISAADTGLVAFVGPVVKNNGIINAKLGRVSLAAGSETATVDLYGDGLVELASSDKDVSLLSENSGVINAEGGTVQMTTAAAKNVVDSVVNMKGVINATSATVKGGKIVLSAKGGKVNVSGKVEANGRNGGGKITVTGKDVDVASGAVLEASAIENGNGGVVDIIGSDTAVFAGSLVARGAGADGLGGTAEISAPLLSFEGDTDLGADNGSLGSLLLDPTFTVIHSGLISIPGTYYMMSAQQLANSMRTANVVVQADEFIDVGTKSGVYNINTGNPVASALLNATLNALPDGDIDLSTWYRLIPPGSGRTAGSLTLQSNTVNFNRDLLMGNGSLSVLANTINLDAVLRGKSGAATVELDKTRLSSTSSLVNVLSNRARIQQGLDMVAINGTVNAAAGTYDEDLTIEKNGVTLKGAQAGVDTGEGSRGAETLITPHSPGVVVNADNVTVDGLSIDGASNGIEILTGADNAKIKNNIITNSTNHGIVVTSSLGSTLTGNLIQKTGNHGIYVVGSANTTLDANQIGVLTSKDYNINGDGILLETSNGSVVFNNRIANTKSTAALIGSGVHVKNSNNVNVAENTIFDADWDGVKVTAGDNIDVTDNDIDHVVRVGVFAQNGTNVDATGNDIFDAKLYGVQFMGVIGSNIASNIIDKTGRDGISVLYAGSGINTVSGNKVNGTGANGIYTAYSKTTISGNEIGLLDGDFNIKGDGVLLENSDGTVVSGNTISNTKSTAAEIGSGVHVKNSKHVTVSKNTIFDTDWDGVKVTNGDDVTVSGNDIDDVVRVGVYAKGTKNITASGNDVDMAGLYGIRFMSVEGSAITDNTIDTVGQDGISLLYSTIGTHTIRGNKVNGTGKNGVYTLYSKSTISGNEIGLLGGDFNIHGDGVLLENSNGTVVSGNTITETLSTADEVGSGVHSKNSNDVTVSGNTIYGTDWDGVKVTGGNNVDVTGNDIDNVERAGLFAKFASDVSFAENDIFGAGMVGAMVQDMFGSSTITDNHIDQIGLDGVNVLRSDDVIVSGNFIGYGDDGFLGADDTYSDRDGVRLEDASDVSVLNNNITNSHEDGVHAINVGGLIRIEGNAIDNSSADGVLVDGYAPGTEIVMLMAKSFSEGEDSGNGLYVLHNDINESGNNGIELINVTGKVRVGHNDVSNSDINGIYVHGAYEETYRGFFGDYSSDEGLDLLISRNDIEDSYLNGIYLSNIDGDIRVKHNDIYNSYYGDGVRVDGVNSNNYVVMSGFFAEDYSGYYGYDGQLVISGNDIDESGYNGIGLHDVGGMVRIKRNHITDSGNDGIYVGDESLYGEDRIALFDYPYGGSNQIDLLIESNHISDSGNTGVMLDGINGDIRILRNCILNSYEGDGIRAQYVNNDYYEAPSVALASIEGDEVPSDEEYYPTNPGHQLIIDNNDIDQSGYDGISLYNVSDLVRISDNSITNSGRDGIYAYNSDVPFYDEYYGEMARFEKYSSSPIDLYILNNTIENYGYDGEVTKLARIIDGPSDEGYYDYNGHAAIELDIGSEGYARIAGNTMGSNFDYGLLGYSGNIDLTGKKNTIHDVNIGMGFYPNDVVKYLSEEGVPSSDAYFQYLANRLHLVGDTIGKTAFVDNAEYFVDLGYGAFFAPGFPTILDGMNATYETAGSIIDPSATGILSISDYAYLESMINHYIDSQDRGLFFFNVETPEGIGIDQKDVFRNFVFSGGQGSGGSLIITGLPNVGGGNGGVTPPPVNFNDITPAAGEEDDTNDQQNVAGVEPAAGGDANNASCWADATQSLGAGTPVTFNFGAGASQLLQDAVNCGNGASNNGQAL